LAGIETKWISLAFAIVSVCLKANAKAKACSDAK
jgi:hypothetical protein